MENTSTNKQWNVAEIQLAYRSKIKPSERPTINSSRDAFMVLENAWDFNQIDLIEQFKVVLTNRANKVLGLVDISTGGITSTVADVRLIFGAALKGGAAGIIVAHNHPSGNLSPSDADIILTKRLKEAGKLLDIQLLDHIIMTSEQYTSLADEGFI